MRGRAGLGALLVLLVAGPLQAQEPLFTDAFPTEEFSARRGRVLDLIGDAVVVMQGATEYPGYIKFRQTGYENLSGFVPVEIDDIERLMAEEGWAERLWKRRQTTTSDESGR